MKSIKKLFLLLVAAIAVPVVSCVNEPMSSEEGYGAGEVAALQEQAASVNASVEHVASVEVGFGKYLNELGAQTGLLQAKARMAVLAATAEEMEAHSSYLGTGVSRLEGTLATLSLQKELAQAIGTFEGSLVALDSKESKAAYDKHVKNQIEILCDGAQNWIGKSFAAYFTALRAEAKLAYMSESLDRALNDQKTSVDGLISDVEAGIRSEEDADELYSLSEDIDGNSNDSKELVSVITEIATELETECEGAIKSVLTTGKYDSSSLKTMTKSVSAVVKATTVTLNELINRVAACEAQIATILQRLSALEASLDVIQSVTFVPEYATEYAVALYTLESTKVSSSYVGCSERTPVDNIELNYLVRPAAVASALVTAYANETATLKVFGYYANDIQLASVSSANTIDFAIQSVALTNSAQGLIKVTVSHNLDDAFYFKQKGAKCAFSITSGKTDLTSKFVDLVPKDKSTNVYVDGIKIDVNEDVIEIDEGKAKTLTAVVTPSDATNKTVSWSSSDSEIATIDSATGELNAVSAGDVTITAKTNDVNEWGNPLTASVKVKVLPAIRLGGPLNVEVGKTAELSLDFPPAMNIESIVWMSSTDISTTNDYTGVATVDDNGTVTGVKYYYNTNTYTYDPAVVISCIINGNITLTHEMHVTALQPTGIRFNDYADDATSVSMKLDGTISLAGTLLPDNVEAEYFTIKYAASKGGSAVWGFVDSQSGSVKAPGSTGTWTVTATVDDYNDKDNRLTKNVKRSIVVNVEPYYVETMRFAQENFTLPPGQTATILPIFTSDVENMPPTSTKLAWESSAPEVVSVDPSTGEMTSHTEGTAVITATTSEASAVPSGHAPVSASFTVIAETPTKPVYVGDYFYSDGDWSTELILDTDGDDRADRSVVGIVFSNVPATSDARLMEEYPAATHGLVVGLVEYTEPTGYYSNVGWDTNSGIVVKAAGYDIFNTNIANGYTNTIGLKEYSKTGDSGYDLSDGSPLYYAHLFRDDAGVFAEPLVATPSGASTWYIPSYYEMSLMKANLTTINNAFAKLREEQLSATDISSSGQYSTSTFKEYIRSVLGQSVPQGSLESICCYSISSGGWVSVGNSVDCPVRVVFAF